MNREIHKIDATDRALGRISTEIATLLRGKHKVTYMPHEDGGDIVEVSNYLKIKYTGNKLEQKKYYKHSGYPGGLKEETLKKKLERDPKFVLRNAVLHMLPDNKLRKEQIKRLKFIESK